MYPSVEAAVALSMRQVCVAGGPTYGAARADLNVGHGRSWWPLALWATPWATERPSRARKARLTGVGQGATYGYEGSGFVGSALGQSWASEYPHLRELE